MKNLLAPAILVLTCSLTVIPARAGQIACRLVTVEGGGKVPENIFLEVPSMNASKRIEPGNNLDAEPLSLSVSPGSRLRLKDGQGADAAVIGEVVVKEGVSNLVIFLVPAVDAGKPEAEKGVEAPAKPDAEKVAAAPPVEPAKPEAATPEGKTTWKCIAADATPKALRKGGVALLNGTERNVRITLGEATQSVSAFESLFLGEPAGKDDFNMAPIKVEFETKDRWSGLSEGASRFTGNTAYWLVVHEQPPSDRPRVQFFQTTVPSK